MGLLPCYGSIVGIVVGSLVSRFGCRALINTGAILTTTGFILSSFMTSIQMLYLTYGVVTGEKHSHDTFYKTLLDSFWLRKYHCWNTCYENAWEMTALLRLLSVFSASHHDITLSHMTWQSGPIWKSEFPALGAKGSNGSTVTDTQVGTLDRFYTLSCWCRREKGGGRICQGFCRKGLTCLHKNKYQKYISPGIGVSLIFIPGVTATQTYFETKRSFASGFSSAGSGLGIVAMVPFVQVLSNKAIFGFWCSWVHMA